MLSLCQHLFSGPTTERLQAEGVFLITAHPSQADTQALKTYLRENRATHAATRADSQPDRYPQRGSISSVSSGTAPPALEAGREGGRRSSATKDPGDDDACDAFRLGPGHSSTLEVHFSPGPELLQDVASPEKLNRKVCLLS